MYKMFQNVELNNIFQDHFKNNIFQNLFLTIISIIVSIFITAIFHTMALSFLDLF